MRPGAAGAFDDGLAADYDRYRVGYADELYDALADYGLGHGRILDVGCGTGLACAALAARGRSMTGIDASEAMLAHARERVPAASFLQASAEDLPFPEASFEGAVSAQAFHWFEEARALRELKRVVRPGGIVGIWWKALMRGDPTRLLREDVARELGLQPPRDLLTFDFQAFDESTLVERRLRVIPWKLDTTVGDFLGYERSRRRARDAYGAAHEAYLARLAERLGVAEDELALEYLHLLYLGRTAPADEMR